MKSRCIILAAFLVVLAFGSTALAQESDLRERLSNSCLGQGEAPACCECGVEALANGLDDEELGALVRILELGAQLEAAGDDQAKTEELINQMIEEQAKLDETKMEALNQQIETDCASVCGN